MRLRKYIATCLLLVLVVTLLPMQTEAKDGIEHNSRFKKYVKERGIDVSEWQGDINWTKVAKDDVDFAIIRVAHRDPESGELITDKYAKKNLKEAKEAGVKIGAYIFSQAITTEEAKEEAEYAASIIKKSGVELDLPLVMDFEYMSTTWGTSGRLYYAELSQKAATDVCLSFMEVADEKGYKPMVYANSWMLNNGINAEALTELGEIWIAEYDTQCHYDGTYSYWQFSSSGSISGIKGRVDMNYRYYKAAYKVSENIKVGTTRLAKEEATFDSLTISWEPVDGATGYYVEKYDPVQTSFVRVKTIDTKDTTTWTDTKVNAEAAYTYRVQAYTIKDDAIGIGDYCETFSAKTGESQDGIVLTSDVYVRNKGKRSGDVISKFDVRTKLKLVGGYGDWYKISKTYGDDAIVGYIFKDLVGFAKDQPGDAVAKVKTKNFHTIKVSWDTVERADGYVVQRRAADDEEFENIAWIRDAKTLTYSDSELDADTEYIYRVRGYATIKEYDLTGEASEEVNATTKSAVTATVKSTSKFRNAPSQDAVVYKKLKPGKTVTVISVSGAYYKVRTKVSGEMTTGYILKKNVNIQ